MGQLQARVISVNASYIICHAISQKMLNSLYMFMTPPKRVLLGEAKGAVHQCSAPPPSPPSKGGDRSVGRCLDGCYGNRVHSRGSLSDLSHWPPRAPRAKGGG